jgi:hypothetical protein
MPRPAIPDDDLLGNWERFNKMLATLVSEQELVAFMRWEVKTRNRPHFLERLYGRFSRLRMTRERDALLSEGKLPK